MAIIRRENQAGKVRYQVRIASIDPITGKRRNLTLGTYDSKREAQRAEREALTQQDRGTLADPTKMTVAELLASWLATKRGTVSENAHKEYEIAIRLHVAPALGRVRVQRLTPAMVQQQYNAWRDAGVSARYMKRFHLVLSQALDYAIQLRIITTNPTSGTTRPAPPKKPMTIWTPDELRRFLAVAVDDIRSPLWHLLGLEGMRRGEALGLRWSDINWERGTAHLRQTVVPDQTKGGAAKIQPRTKTATGARTVRLTDATLALLREHRDRQRFTRQAAGEEWQVLDLIVTTRTGAPVNPSNVIKALHRLADEAGVPRITVHGLRHTCASLMLASGVPVKLVSERLGHASAVLTLDVYGHLLPDSQAAAAEAMNRIVALDPTGTDTTPGTRP